MATASAAQPVVPTSVLRTSRSAPAAPDTSRGRAERDALGVRVTLVDSLVRAADPGAVESIVIRVRHDGDGPVAFLGSLELPAAWHAITGVGEFVVEPGEDAVRIIGVAIPRTARPGAQMLYFMLRALDDSSLHVSTPIPLDVRGRRSAALELVRVPPYVLTGDRYVAQFLASNNGNVDLSARVRVRSAQTVDVTWDSAFTLVAGSSRLVDVTVETARTDPQVTRNDLLVQLSTRDSSGEAAAVESEAASTVLVVHRGTTVTEPRDRYVSTAELTGSGPQAGVRSVGLSGSGLLDEKGTLFLDYAFRTVQEPRPTVAGEWEEYRVRLKAPAFDLQLGDQVYGLSQLTEPGRYAFGAGGSVAAGPVTAGGFLSRWRHARAPSEEYGLTLGVRPVKPLSLGGNFVARSDTSLHRVWSGQTEMIPPSPILPIVELEYARNVETGETTSQGSAWLARFHSTAGILSYDFSREVRDLTYDGYLPGTSQSLGSVQLQLGNPVALSARFGDYASAPFTAAASVIGRRLRQREIALGVFDLAEVSLQDAWRVLGSSPEAQDWLERSVRLRLRASAGPLTFSANGELGTLDDQRNGIDRAMRGAGVNAQLQSGAYALSLFADRTVGPSLYFTEVSARSTVGLQASGPLERNTLAEVRAYGMRQVAARTQVSGVVDATLSHQFSNAHRAFSRLRLPIGGAVSSVVRAGDLVWQLGYLVPLAVPRLSTRSEATLRVRVRNRSTSEPVPNALVRIEEHVALTDDRGEARLADLSPGRYRISVIPRDGFVGAFATNPSSRMVDLPEGGRTTADILVDRAARLAGVLRVASQSRADDSNAEAPHLQGVTVVLASARDTIRTATDARGAFEFSAVAAGTWQIFVPLESLPMDYSVESPENGVVLAAGEQAHVELPVVPRRRELHMLMKRELNVPARPSAPLPARVKRP